MTSKRFWKGFIQGKYAVEIKDKNKYLTFIKLCNEKGLKWIQGTPDYKYYSTFLNLCIIYESAIDSLLCVDYDYCINNGYEVIYTFPLSDDVRDVECRTTVT